MINEKIRTVLINEKLWNVYGTHSKVIDDAIKKMIDNTEIKIEVEGTEILIARDDFDNISVDVFEDGEVLGGKFEFLGVFDPSDYPYFFPEKMEKRGDRMKLNEFLKEARIKKGLTQRQLAEKLGVKYQLIQQYEYGKLIPSVKRLIQLAKILDIDLNDIVK